MYILLFPPIVTVTISHDDFFEKSSVLEQNDSLTALLFHTCAAEICCVIILGVLQ